MSANDDRFFPSRNKSRDVFDDNGLSENSSIEDISDGSIGTLPHFFKFELFDSSLIGGNGGAFDANFAFSDGLCGFDGDFIIGGISVLDTEVKVEYL